MSSLRDWLINDWLNNVVAKSRIVVNTQNTSFFKTWVIGGPNDDDQSLDAFDDFFNSRSSVGQNGQRGLGGPEFTSTPNAKRGEGETQTYFDGWKNDLI